MLAHELLDDGSRGVAFLCDREDDLKVGILLQEGCLEVLVEVGVETTERAQDGDARLLS
jgi:hypothetical protein